jgi:hypothetical protein
MNNMNLPSLSNLFGILLISSVLQAQSPGGSGMMGLNLWLKANSGSSCLSNGCSISNWSDNSGSSNDASQSSSAIQPTFIEVATNYNPAINIDNAGKVKADRQYFSLPNSTIPTGGSDYTFFLMVDNVTNAGFPLAGGLSSTHSANRVRVDPNGLVKNSWQNSSTDLLTSTLSSGGGRQLIAINYNSTVPTRTIYVQGDNKATSTDIGISTSSSNNKIGVREDLAGTLSGNINEIIIYAQSLSNVEQHQVSSYLAIKYGITLAGSSGVAQGNYVTSNNTLLWDASLAPSYQNQIIGIGRDDATELRQHQSITEDGAVRIYREALSVSNVNNMNNFGNDLAYILVGSNAGLLKEDAATSSETPTATKSSEIIDIRLDQEFKVTKTNVTDDFNMEIDIDGSSSLSSYSDAELRLIVDDDGDFSNGGTTVYHNGDGTGVVLSQLGSTLSIQNLSTTHFANNSTQFMTVGAHTPILSVGTLQHFNIACSAEGNQVSLGINAQRQGSFSINRSTDGFSFERIKILDYKKGMQQLVWYDQDFQGAETYYQLDFTDERNKNFASPIKVVTCANMQPAQVRFDHEANQLILNSEKTGIVQLTNSFGQVVLSQSIAAGKTQISLNQLPKGLYIGQLSSPERGDTKSFKLVR